MSDTTTPDAGTDAAKRVEQIYMDSGVAAARNALQADFQNYQKNPNSAGQIDAESLQLRIDNKDQTGALTALAVDWAATNTNVKLSADGLSTAIGSFQDTATDSANGPYNIFMAQTLSDEFGVIKGAGFTTSPVDGIDDTGDTISYADIQAEQTSLEQTRLNGGKPVEQAYDPPPQPSEWQKMLRVFGIDGG